MMKTSTPNPLVAFYRGHSLDDRGRRIDEIWSWDDAALEQTHDYIQWLFPLVEPSGANPRAPTLDETTIAAFRENLDLQQRLRRSLDVMLGFYGFALQRHPDGVRVDETADAGERRRVWLTPGNHNFLRLTRMLKSLRTLGLEREAGALYDALAHLDDGGAQAIIGPRTLAFWSDAIQH